MNKLLGVRLIVLAFLYINQNLEVNVMAGESKMSDAMKSTRGTPKSGYGKGQAGGNAYSMPSVKMPFGGNISQGCNKSLPKAPKGLC